MGPVQCEVTVNHEIENNNAHLGQFGTRYVIPTDKNSTRYD